MNFNVFLIAGSFIFLVTVSVTAQTTNNTADSKIIIDVASKGVKIPSSMYGIFFEEINHSGDGGLYAELIRGRSFGDGTPGGWSARGGARISLDDSRPLNLANP